MAKKKYEQGFQLFGFPILHPLNIILILNVIVYLIQISVVEDSDPTLLFTIDRFFGLEPRSFIDGRYWQILTYGFFHAPGGFLPLHLIFNMYGFYLLGMNILPRLGKIKFVSLYIFSLLTGGGMVVFSSYLGKFLYGTDTTMMVTIGASGAIFGLLAMFGFFYPDQEIWIFFFNIKAKNAVWFSLLLGGIFAYLGSAPISNTCHLGGALGGILFYQFFVRDKDDSMLMEAITRAAQIVDKVEIKELPVLSNNQSHIRKVTNLKTLSEKESYLLPLQVKNANICPPNTFNLEDSYCLQCEWLVNCLLRKNQQDAKSE
jgi:membrane associated rhomboid family serine protease